MISVRIDKQANQRYLWFNEKENTYDEIKTYVPRFYDSIYEMQEIYKAQGRMIDTAQAAFELALNNMFIDYMDKSNVSALEDFLSIVPNVGSSLEERKLVLINHFRGYGKISADVINETSCNYNLTAETFFDEQDSNQNFILKIKLRVPNTSQSTSDYIENIRILDIRLPVHLKKYYEIWFNSSSKVGFAFISVHTYQLLHNCNKADLSELPDIMSDDNDGLLLDDSGNIIINEEKEGDL